MSREDQRIFQSIKNECPSLDTRPWRSKDQIMLSSRDYAPYLNCLLALAVELQRQTHVTGARGGGVLGQEGREQRAPQLTLQGGKTSWICMSERASTGHKVMY